MLRAWDVFFVYAHNSEFCFPYLQMIFHIPSVLCFKELVISCTHRSHSWTRWPLAKEENLKVGGTFRRESGRENLHWL